VTRSAIPSPSRSQLMVGPFTIHAYALCILTGIALAQGIGRLGNWFNQELYGGPTSLPWAVHITHPGFGGVPGYHQPTFLYELIWDVLVAGLVVLAERRFRLGHGRAFALYVAASTVGRGLVELLRTDHANHLLGLRLNTWTSAIVFLGAITYLWSTRRHGREDRREMTGLGVLVRDLGRADRPGVKVRPDRSDVPVVAVVAVEPPDRSSCRSVPAAGPRSGVVC
jgi:prolipoprotein diacylglyceryltransferase